MFNRIQLFLAPAALGVLLLAACVPLQQAPVPAPETTVVVTQPVATEAAAEQPAQPTPLPQIVLEPTDIVSLLALEHVNIRHGPGLTYQIAGLFMQGDMRDVLMVTPDGGWWQVRCPENVAGDCYVIADPSLTLAQTSETLANPQVVESDVEWVLVRADIAAMQAPGPGDAVVASFVAGAIVQVTGATADGAWWQVVCPQSSAPCYLNAVFATPTGAPDADYYLVLVTYVQYVQAQVDTPLREGPAADALPAGVLFAGQVAQVTGVTPDQSWWRVDCDVTQTTARECYVSANPAVTTPTAQP